MRASRRPNTSSTSLRATCVATARSVGAWKLPTFSAGETRSAALARLGRPRIVNVDDVERDRLEQAVDRTADVDGNGAAPSGRDLRQRLTCREHGNPARPVVAREDQLRLGAGRVQQPARLPHRLLRARRRDDRDAVATSGELAGGGRDPVIDLVVGVPGVRRDLGDRQALRRHASDANRLARPPSEGPARRRAGRSLIAAVRAG